MQRVIGYMRKAITEFDMIQDGDRIAVGISGGKDSIALLVGLMRLKRFIGIDYDVVGITLDPMFNGVATDYSPVKALCEELGCDYHVIPTQIGEIVFDIKKEPNPCSLCARLRRGALHDATKKYNCNKIALGHHYDDTVETFMMNLFNEGRVGCYAPVTYLSRKDITMIRPLVFAPEVKIISAVKRNNYPIVKSECPVDGTTNRQRTKEFLAEREKLDKGFTLRIFGAMRRSGVDGWGFKDIDKELDDEN